jgi:hypothetical protein
LAGMGELFAVLSHLSIMTYVFIESRLFLAITLGAFLINDHRGRLND